MFCYVYLSNNKCAYLAFNSWKNSLLRFKMKRLSAEHTMCFFPLLFFFLITVCWFTHIFILRYYQDTMKYKILSGYWALFYRSFILIVVCVFLFVGLALEQKCLRIFSSSKQIYTHALSCLRTFDEKQLTVWIRGSISKICFSCNKLTAFFLALNKNQNVTKRLRV